MSGTYRSLPPADPVLLREKLWLNSQSAKDLRDARMALALPRHISPFSTFVAAIGNHWHPGCYEAVEAMCQYAWQQTGAEVALSEQADRCYQPYDGLGTMRNQAYMRAIREGYEFILYVDNDVQPEQDSLLRLLHRFVPVVSALVIFADGEDHGLSMPKMERGQGLALVSDVVLSMVLFQTAVFFPWATTPFWQDALGADEEYHFQRLSMAGHRPFVDTDVVVTVVSPPHYPLDRSVGRTVADLAGFGRPQGQATPGWEPSLWRPR